MGFRGSRVRIPPSRLKRRAEGLAVFRRAGRLQPPPLACGSRLSGQIPPSRLSEDQASHRVPVWGFFFGWDAESTLKTVGLDGRLPPSLVALYELRKWSGSLKLCSSR